ncbi:MAG: DUF427 domain-containing protein [Candidatus Dormibacteria bacterium]
MWSRPERKPPGDGQESVWDYPRPPRVEPVQAIVEVLLGDQVLARSDRALRVLETSHPPVYYLPPEDVRTELLSPSARTTYCEFKGVASYVDAAQVPEIGWTYPHPSPGYEAIANHIAFYPGRVTRASVNGETVRAQTGGFYGGWITDSVVGPFKGQPGTAAW